jgi:predicted dehydrogenase
MTDESPGRRRFLKEAARGALGSAAVLGAFGASGFESSAGESQAVHTVAVTRRGVGDSRPTCRFAVCGMSHDHIFGMVEAIQSGGGELVAAFGAEAQQVNRFKQKFPDPRLVASTQEILDDPSIDLVLSSTIASERAALGIAAMQAGKDFLSDKPGATTLEQIEAIRRTVAATARIYGIMYSERFEVKAAVYAGELVHSGEIGTVVQTINIAPHQIRQRNPGRRGRSAERPGWFWDPLQSGGILCDIGSHQVDQFLFFTGSTQATVVGAQVANVANPDKPQFQDFGDMTLRGNRGTGYVRVDWLTPDGLGTWGDGRLFILGTEGYIEIRKYCDVARSPRGNTLFVVNGQRARMIDCNRIPLPFGAQFVADVVNRTQTAQDQAQCLLAAELAVRAQMTAATLRIPA